MEEDLTSLANGLPWLLLPSYGTFFCFKDSKLHPLLELPADQIGVTVNRLSIRGSSHGWLALVDEDGPLIFLLNPITTQQIQLPPFTTLPGVLDYRPSESIPGNGINRLEYQMPISRKGCCLCPSCLELGSQTSIKQLTRSWIPNDMKMLYAERIILTGNPLCEEEGGGGCTAVALLKGGRLAFCTLARGEVTEGCWTATHQPEGVLIEDLTSWNGQLYALLDDGSLAVCDLKDPVNVIPHMEIKKDPTRQLIMKYNNNNNISNKRLVVSPDNDLLLIAFEYDDEFMYSPRITGFKVFKLFQDKEDDKDGWNWEEIKGSIGSDHDDYVIFLGLNASMCLNANDFPCSQLASNRIYFTDSSFMMEVDDQLGYDFGVYNPKTGKIEPLPNIRPVPSSCLPPVSKSRSPVWNGQLYALLDDGSLAVCDLKDPVNVIPHMEIKKDPTRQLIMNNISNKRLVVFKLFQDKEDDWNWKVIKGSIGADHDDYVIFLGLNASMCLNAKDFPCSQLASSRIYFTDSSFMMEDDDQLGYDFGVYNPETSTIEPLTVFIITQVCISCSLCHF
ncbi:hypothetical protein Dimus_019140 [Dionaea muscipula]